MKPVAKKHQEKLSVLKDKINDFQQYFYDNVQRYHEYMKFVFKTSMSEGEVSSLQEIGKPTIEFNILEAYISRQRGEFAKQQPSLKVRAADGLPPSAFNQELSETIDVVEGHLRSIFFDGSNDKLEYNVYTDLLAGGFSVMRVFTEYVDEMSFEQNICVERVFDPTLCGFDPLARDSHKGDGAYCYELYPMTKEEFELRFGADSLEGISFTRDFDNFSWSYQSDKEQVILVCDFYAKQQKEDTIVKLSNGHTITKKEYTELLKQWEESGFIEQPPVVIKERKTIIEKIVRYRLIENKVLEFAETNYKYLPLVFVDGNSVNIAEGNNNYQMTRPYVYHAKGIQRLKNFAGQSLANELENTIQHKFIVAIESIPNDYLSAYENVQKADTLIYNHFLDTNNPAVTLPPPREVMRTPIPPQISETFRISDEMTQTILGSYDASAGISQAALSGVAFARSAIQSNNASVPYIVGYIKGLNRVAQIIIDLIPKYYRTPRSLPILLPSGKRDYVEINRRGYLYMNYQPNFLQVKVDVGVNFAMQKEIALQTVVSLSQSMPAFAQFFGQKGLRTLLDNLEIRGIDDLKDKAEQYEKELEEQQRMQQEQQMQQQQMAVQQMQQQQKMQQMAEAKAIQELQSPTKGNIDLMKLQIEAQDNAANIAIKEKEAETKFIETMSKIRSSDVSSELKAAEIEAENTRSAVEATIAIAKHVRELEGDKDGR